MSVDVPIVQCHTQDGRFAIAGMATHRIECYHGDDPRRVPYGQVMYDVWQRYADRTGMIWIEGDIAIEPLHIREIANLLHEFSDCVIAVPFRIYPASSHGTDVTWPFYVEIHNCGERILLAHEPIPFVVRSFGLGCTYLPARLFDLLGKGLCDWDWPSLDWKLSVAARDNGITIVTTKTPAVHLHY